MIMDTEEVIFSGEIHVKNVIVQADRNNVPDGKLRDDFVSELEENGWDDKCNEKIRGIEKNKDLYLSTCFVFHIGTKRKKNLDLHNIITFYIGAIFEAAYPEKSAKHRPAGKVNKITAQKDISDKYNRNNEMIELKISINDGKVIDC